MPLYSSTNGKAERKHRLITETGLTLLATTSLLLDFWDEAFLIATYVINRLPSFNNNGESPFEIINRQKLYYSFMKFLDYIIKISLILNLINVCFWVLPRIKKATNAFLPQVRYMYMCLEMLFFMNLYFFIMICLLSIILLLHQYLLS